MGEKALSLDGFLITFYKGCWDVVKGDLMRVFNDFFNKEFLDISLIPKKERVEEMGNFCPVSLLGSTSKIISKCLKEKISQLKRHHS